MIQKAFLLVIGLSFGICAFSAEKPGKTNKSELAGWQEFKFGWTQEELLSSNKSIVELEEKDDGKGTQYANYGLKNYEVAGRKFDVKFWFDRSSNRLEEISLSLIRSQKAASACPVFHAALNEKYGAPLHFEESQIEDTRVKKGFWKSSLIKVDIICMIGLVDLMSVTYKPINAENDSGV